MVFELDSMSFGLGILTFLFCELFSSICQFFWEQAFYVRSKHLALKNEKKAKGTETSSPS